MKKYNFPETLITDRFILEAVSTFHAEEAYEAIDKDREYLSEFLPWCTDSYSLEDTISFYEIQQENFEEEDAFHYKIIDKETDYILGSIGIDIKANGYGEIGYWLSKDMQGNGVITECLNDLVEYSFTHSSLIRLDIYTDLDNKKSKAVAEKAGFVFEGIRYCQSVDSANNVINALRFTKLKDKKMMEKITSIQKSLKDVYEI